MSTLVYQTDLIFLTLSQKISTVFDFLNDLHQTVFKVSDVSNFFSVNKDIDVICNDHFKNKQ